MISLNVMSFNNSVKRSLLKINYAFGINYRQNINRQNPIEIVSKNIKVKKLKIKDQP